MNSQNTTCALCHAYLFPEDDVVYCPVCGAPHHRECYNSVGHCALEQLHGTDRQYDKIKHPQEQENARQAQDTNQPNFEQQPFNTPFGAPYYIDFLGGVPKDYKLDEEVTADEAKNFVLSNTMRYIPKFAKLSKHNKTSWNFMAFFFPCGWFLSRKMYKSGIIVGFLTIILTLLSLPLLNSLNNLGILAATDYYQMAQLMADNLSSIPLAITAVALIGSLLTIVLRIICGIFGDYWYKNHTVSTIKQIKKESADLQADFRKKGGVNLFLFIIGTMAVEYIPAIIATFI